MEPEKIEIEIPDGSPTDPEEIREEVMERGNAFKRWFVRNVNKPIAEKVLFLVAYMDSFISPIPPDPFLAILTIFNPKKWRFYAAMTTAISIFGGLTGYLIGYFLFATYGEYLVNLYNLHEELQALGTTFSDNAFWAMFIAAFTPIPYQIFTVAGGIFKINLFIFVLGSIVGRVIRFFTIAFLMRFVGKKFGDLIFKYLNWILLIGGITILVYIFFFKI